MNEVSKSPNKREESDERINGLNVTIDDICECKESSEQSTNKRVRKI